MDELMMAVTVCSPLLMLTPVVARFRAGARREALVLLAALVGAVIVSLELQFLLLRPRPDVAALMPVVPTPSFPSGHAAMAAALATFATFAWSRRVSAGLWLFAGLVGWSRVWVGHHFPSDVVVGAVVGASIAALMYGTQLARDDHRPRWAWWIWPQLALVVLAGVGAYLGLTHFAWLTVPGADKVLHFLLFGLLAFFVVGWLARFRATWVILAFAALASADEVAQAWMPTRTFDYGDLACTLAGIFFFGFLGARLVAHGRASAARLVP